MQNKSTNRNPSIGAPLSFHPQPPVHNVDNFNPF